MHRTKNVSELPQPNEIKRKDQIWIWLTDESPHSTFLYKNSLTQFSNIFNWSMSYRSDSDIPVPYGRVKDRIEKTNLSQITSHKSKLAAILISNSGGSSRRRNYLNKLSEFMPIDIWGGLSNSKEFKCSGHYKQDCKDLDKYKFYLSFENAACSEYITEKVWWNAYHKKSVPILLGGKSRLDYETLLPPNSFIHIDDFKTVKELAEFVQFLGNNDEYYKRFHLWRNHYQILNEH